MRSRSWMASRKSWTSARALSIRSSFSALARISRRTVASLKSREIDMGHGSAMQVPVDAPYEKGAGRLLPVGCDHNIAGRGHGKAQEASAEGQGQEGRREEVREDRREACQGCREEVPEACEDCDEACQGRCEARGETRDGNGR